LQVFDVKTVNVTSKESEANERLVLKEALHQQHGVQYFAGIHITESVLRTSTFRGTKLVEGRTIQSQSEMAKRNAISVLLLPKFG